MMIFLNENEHMHSSWIDRLLKSNCLNSKNREKIVSQNYGKLAAQLSELAILCSIAVS